MVEPRHQTWEIANAVTVRVLKSPHMDLIDDGVLIPVG
jgi:hypothetical protein